MPIQYSKTATFQHDILILLRPTFFKQAQPYISKQKQSKTHFRMNDDEILYGGQIALSLKFPLKESN